MLAIVYNHMTLSSIMQPAQGLWHSQSERPFGSACPGCVCGLARQIIALNISYVAQFSLKTCPLPTVNVCVCVHVSLMTV